jgi:hypothetical protein
VIRDVVASRWLAIVEYSRDLELARTLFEHFLARERSRRNAQCPGELKTVEFTAKSSSFRFLVLIMDDTDDPSGESNGLQWEEYEEALGR